MKINFNKLASAGLKAGGAVASAVGAIAVMALVEEGNESNRLFAVGAGLGTSSVILATQAVSDTVAAFKQPKDGE